MKLPTTGILKLLRVLNTCTVEQLEAMRDLMSSRGGDESKGFVKAIILLKKYDLDGEDEDGD